MTESNRIELKRELTDELDIEKEVIAFLNYREGGIIYVGIDKDGTVVGVKDIDGDMLKIKDRIRKNILPSPMGLFDVLAENIDGTNVIKIFLASGSEKPYYKAKYGMSTRGCYIRTGTAAEPMPTDMIENLFAHRVRNSLKNIPSPRQKLTFRQLRIYYESKNLALNDAFEQTLDLLTDDGRYNYVAFLLADENNVSIKVAKYSGTDRLDLISNNEFGYCSLLKATDSVLDKLNTENYIQTQKTEKFRVDTPLWNKLAVREAVINAIVHNDYTNEVPPKFEIFSDRLEITSYGSIPYGLSQDEFFSGVSMPRNKELMRVFRDVEMVEALGSGMPVILHNYGRQSYEFLPHFIRQIIPSIVLDDDTKNVTKMSPKCHQNVTKSITLSNINELTDRQRDILSVITKCDTKNVAENVAVDVALNTTTIARLLSVDRKTIQRDLTILLDNQIVKRVGSDRYGYWTIGERLNELGGILVADTENDTKNVPLNVAENVAVELTDEKQVVLNLIAKNTKNDTKNDTKNVALNDTKTYTEKRRDAIVDLIRKDNTITVASIAKQTGVKPLTIKRTLSEMRHIVQHVGPTRGGHWEFL